MNISNYIVWTKVAIFLGICIIFMYVMMLYKKRKILLKLE